MCKRREIAGRTDRTARRNDREHISIQEREQGFDDFRPCAGEPRSKRIRFEQQHEPNDVCSQRLTDAARVTANQVQLKLTYLSGGDALVREGAKARRNAIAHVLASDGVAHDLDAAKHCGSCLGRQFDACSARKPAQVDER
jgi:hypothetical protein